MNNSDHKAGVSLSSSTSDAVLRYAINKEADEQATVYQRPLQIKEASTLCATLFDAHNQPIASWKAFIPVNKALGKPVVFNSSYTPQYAAAGVSSLTDGIKGTTAFKGGKWLGFLAKDLDITLDMQGISARKTLFTTVYRTTEGKDITLY